jgi:hypothetical protein
MRRLEWQRGNWKALGLERAAPVYMGNDTPLRFTPVLRVDVVELDAPALVNPPLLQSPPHGIVSARVVHYALAQLNQPERDF